jgi:hypothetical protein
MSSKSLVSAIGTGSAGQVLTAGSNGTSYVDTSGYAYTIAPSLSPSLQWSNTASITGSSGYAFNEIKSATLTLKGENADIDINGKSLMKILEGIEQRLGLLSPNTELEAEWDELLELGQAYRKLEAELLEKKKMWETLKK